MSVVRGTHAGASLLTALVAEIDAWRAGDDSENTFAVTDMWFRQTWLSILVVFLSHHGLRILRQVAGESNLSDRTLVDSRFLI